MSVWLDDYPQDEVALLRETPIAAELERKGGKWLGKARSWLQWHKLNGSEVTWGSNDELRTPFTVSEIERLASEVAEAAIAEWAEEGKRQVKP